MNPIDQIVAAREQVVRYSVERIDPAYLTMPHPILADYLEENPHHLHERYPQGHKKRRPGQDGLALSTLHSLREGSYVVVAQHPDTGKVAAWSSPKTLGRLLTILPEMPIDFEGTLTGPVHDGPLGTYTAGTLPDGRPTVYRLAVRKLGNSPRYPDTYIDAASTGEQPSAEAAQAIARHRAWNPVSTRAKPLEDTSET